MIRISPAYRSYTYERRVKTGSYEDSGYDKVHLNLNGRWLGLYKVVSLVYTVY